MAKKDKLVYVTDFLAKRSAGLVDETGADIVKTEEPKKEAAEPIKGWDEKGKIEPKKGKGRPKK